MKKLYILLVALFIVHIATAQWFPQNSNTGQTLRSVYFTNSNTGYIVGDAGLILKTTDGGLIWTALPSGEVKNLHSVHFPDANTGYAVGDSGTILKTVNAGTTWEMLFSGTLKHLRSVYFTDSLTGYAVGGNYNWSLPPQGIVLKTSNGGTTWAISLEDPGFWMNSIFFTDGATGYIVGSNANTAEKLFLKTIDSGETWTASSSQYSGCALESVFFTDSNTGFAVGDQLVFAKTIDAGTSWITVNECLMDVGDWYSVYFSDSNTGYRVGKSGWPSIRGRIFQTTDGGDSWDLSLSLDSYSCFYSVFFTGPDTGYVVGSPGIIFKTINGGLVGLNEIPVNPGPLTIYPNPASTRINIGSSANGQLSILNLNGQPLLQQSITEFSFTIDISSLPSGIYLVKVIGESDVQLGKIIKE